MITDTTETVEKTEPQPGIKDAGKAFLSALPADQRETPFSDEQLGELAEAAGSATVSDDDAAFDKAEKPGEKPAAKATDAKGDEVSDAALEREDGARWNEDAKRWQKQDGTFADGEAPTVEELQALAEAKAKPADEKTDALKVTLRGRNDEPVEIEVSDPAVAEILRANAKDGLRRREFSEKMQEVESREAELQSVERALQIDPIGFTLNHIAPERQVEVAKALLLEHFDALKPQIEQWYEDAAARNGERVALRDKMKTTGDQLTQKEAQMTHARNCMRAAQSLVPDSADPEIVKAFARDAERDLIDAARSGEKVTPETVPQLLANRVKLYGFTGGQVEKTPSQSTSTGTTPSKDAIVARPVTDAAKAVATRGQEKVEQAKEAQKRVKVVQTQRRAAGKVAPPGVGAATVRVPLIPQNATIKEASRAVRNASVGGWPGSS